MKRYLAGFLFLCLVGTGLFLFYQTKKEFNFIPSADNANQNLDAPKEKLADADIENQKPLTNPPDEIKAIYLTSWSAGNKEKIDYAVNLIKSTELNAVVIDIKDFSGYVAYDIKNAEVEKYKTKEIRIPKINTLIKKLHDEGIYVIARITVFQDPLLAKARPDLAIKSSSTGKIWQDNKKLSWFDPNSKEVWGYNIVVAKDAASRGFDEINFDYIRFPSDGDLNDMVFPFWDGKTLWATVIKNFFQYLRLELKDTRISADLFGLTTINQGDMGIGQVIENAYAYFDFVAPMVYPSHYYTGAFGYKNPAEHPYEVVKNSLESALKRLQNYESGILNNGSTTNATTTNIHNSKLRPWLQDFDLGADYDAVMVRKEIQAVYDAASSTPELSNGFMLWNPSNVYTREALKPE